MKSRSLSWSAPTAAPRLSVSDDGWLRAELRSDPAGAHGLPISTVERRRDDRRRWRRHDVTAGPPRGSLVPVRPGFHAGGVEGVENPNDDTRGTRPVSGALLPLTFGAPRRVGPASETDRWSVAVGTCRDGIRIELPLQSGSSVFGLGEKTGTLDKRGRTWVLWNTDEPSHSPDSDPLYQSIPVIYIWQPERTRTLFVDTAALAYIDAGDCRDDTLVIEVYAAAADVYLREDAALPDAVGAFTELTGRASLPPRWSLGFLQSRYSYETADRVRDVARRFRAEQIPCDGLFLDIHYMDGFRVFTWDRHRFPDPAGLIAELRESGFRVIPIIDPGVKVDDDYAVYTEGRDRDLFLGYGDGSPYHGAVWPGEAVFPDFLRDEVVDWWAELHRDLIESGVAGIWNDMNEPADFTGDELVRQNFTVPDELVARRGSDAVPFGEVHNAYADGMNRAVRRAFERYRPRSRPFVLTRAGCSGVQRNAAVWTGDNHSTWEHLGLQIPMLLNLGLSGVPFCGADVGGFQYNADAELFRRWFAAASLLPFFRAHSALHTRDHEPWSFGDPTTRSIRASIVLRYRLLPYLYTLAEEATRTGAPLMRPLIWQFPTDPVAPRVGDQFMIGDALLVAPLIDSGPSVRRVYLPGGGWYDCATGTRIYGAPEGYRDGADAAAGFTVAVVGSGIPPIYQREGTIVPFQSERPHTGDPGDGVLRLLVATDAAGFASGRVYEDDGDGFGYRDGVRRTWRFRLVPADGTEPARIVVECAGDEDASWPGQFETVVARMVTGSEDPVGDLMQAADGSVLRPGTVLPL